MAGELRVAIVADDLTGALDSAAPFAARGAATRVIVTPEHNALSQAPAVVSLSTNSRHLSAEAAAQAVLHAVKSLAQNNKRLLFKKIDSTLRGNVVAETLAALDASGKSHALVCPAFPGQGRTMVNGELLVHGVPLRESAIARDALSAPLLQPLAQAFADSRRRLAVHALTAKGALQLAAGAGQHVYIADAASADDLARLADFTLAERDALIAIGSAGLATAIADLGFGAPKPPPIEPLHGTALFVIGSRTPQTAMQAAYLMAHGAHKTEWLAAAGRLNGFAHARPETTKGKRPRALLLTIRQMDGVALDAKQIAEALAGLARETLQREQIAAIVVTGGDTARALFDALELTAIDVVGELLPGIALGMIDHGRGRLPVVSKAGAFGGENLFVTIRDKLIAASE